MKNDLTALILEARLIGINKPKFNSILRDGSSRLYIKISEDSFPLVKIARGKDVDDDELCFGPFMSHKQTKRVLRTARRIFKFCQNPGEASSSGRPCFYYQIDLCDGACVGKISGKEYRRKIGYIKRFLRGEIKTLIKNLDRRIRVAAKNEQFAKAGKLKGLRNAVYKASEVKHGLSAFLTAKPEREKQLRNLSELLAGQGLVANLDRIEGFDISTWQQKQTVGGMVVFVMGMESKKDYRMFKIRSRQEGDVAGMEEMLRRRFAHSDWPTTGLILVDGGKPQVSAALKVVPEKVVVLGLAKKDERLVFMKDDQLVELQLDENWPAQALLMEIRDEAHRFANNYQKKVRGVIVDK